MARHPRGSKIGQMGKNITGFCDVCMHGVYDMDKHLKTEEHRRSLRKMGKAIDRRFTQ